MNIQNSVRGALRRLGERLSAVLGAQVPEGKRRTLAIPSILQTDGPPPNVMPKPTPANLRRFGETPVARKAINTIKDRVAAMHWRVQPQNGRSASEIENGEERVRILTDNLDSPNSDDAFRSMAEQVLEDAIVGGFGAIELQLTGDVRRVFHISCRDRCAHVSRLAGIIDINRDWVSRRERGQVCRAHDQFARTGSGKKRHCGNRRRAPRSPGCGSQPVTTLGVQPSFPRQPDHEGGLYNYNRIYATPD